MVCSNKVMQGNALLMASVALATTATLARAQEPQSVDLTTRSAAIAQVSSLIKAAAIVGGLRKVVIEGEYVLNTWWLPASEIEFKPGSSLLVSVDAAAQSREIYIVASRITIDDPANPPKITWQTVAVPPQPDRGQASAGAPGAGAGAAGGSGTSGAPGATGARGADAPSLTLMFKQLSPGPLAVDFKGGKGGAGGAGQKGGDGGAGAQGDAARQDRRGGPFGTTIWLPGCASGPGWGGRGGDGGAGGAGGTGGTGGAGGSITLVSLPEALPTITQAVRSYVDGGVGGDGGPDGLGGNPGFGGPEGPLANFCNSAGRVGAPGAAGVSQGQFGVAGQSGPSGRLYVGSLDASQFKGLFDF